MGQRRRAREYALQMLFQIDLTGSTPPGMFTDFWADQNAGEDVRLFAQKLVLGTHRLRGELDRIIEDSTEHWRLERMAAVDRNVLRMAGYEMLCHPDTPPVVVIDEAIEIAKKYGTEDSGGFINGILDAIRRQMERGEISLEE